MNYPKTIYLHILNDDDLYEFAIRDDHTILFINVYYSNSTYPDRICLEKVPQSVLRKLRLSDLTLKKDQSLLSWEI